MAVERWAWIYFVSFILLVAFVVVNVLIAIVLNAMEEAREVEGRRVIREEAGIDGEPEIDPEAHAPVVERIAILRAALDELELQLAAGSANRPGTKGARP
jgi:voltage-gated sodium channel